MLRNRKDCHTLEHIRVQIEVNNSAIDVDNIQITFSQIPYFSFQSFHYRKYLSVHS